VTRTLSTRGGRPEPLGVEIAEDGVNVAVWSAYATTIWFGLFDETGTEEIARVRLHERHGPVHHAWIGGVRPGDRYGLRAEGPYEPESGHLFNPAKLLIDPLAAALDRPFQLTTSMFDRRRQGATTDYIDSAPDMPKAIVMAPPTGLLATPPTVVPADRVTYELSVRAFTKLHPDVPDEMRGTLAGLAGPALLQHLRDLGVTTVELMPLAAWIDERHLPPLGLSNAWGYNPIVFGAPDPRVVPGGWSEIRAAVDRLHAAGLEVILDVVVNHTGESDADGPMVSLRGLDNASYYRLAPDQPGTFVNDTGCGNTLALDRPHALRLVMDSLRRWALWGGIDGFRFDLATVLGRRAEGFDPAAPLISAIAQDPVLARLKIVAEPWDLGPGGYRLGEFPPAWFEWNDRYRDTVRRFWRGDAGMIGDLATRVSGSSDVFAGKRPSRSVNFVTAHDGFTLRDLVSYGTKHNEANGEENRDGRDENFSWNNGVEGETAEPSVVAARRRDEINLLATLLLSRGTPMLSMGAELGHTQHGNNNAYAQDNATTWINWANKDEALIRTVRSLIEMRRAHPALTRDAFLTGRPTDDHGAADVIWLARDGRAMDASDWSDAAARALALQLTTPATDEVQDDCVVVVLNADRHAITQILPMPRRGLQWRVAFETMDGETRPGEAPLSWIVAPRSVVLFAQHPTQDVRATGSESDELDVLARAVGIASEWWEISGRHHRVSDDTKRALLAAMGLPAGTAGEVREARDAVAARLRSGIVPRIATADEGDPIAIPLPERRGTVLPARLLAVSETGEVRRLPMIIGHGDGGGLAGRLPPLPTGVWRIQDERAPNAVGTLIVAPKTCYLPEVLRRKAGAFGVSAQLYGLRRASDQGIGDFTALGAFAAAAGHAGAAVVGINPLHALFGFDRTRASPYYPSDRRFIDQLYLDVEALCADVASPAGRAALAASAGQFADLRAAATIDYRAVAAAKGRVLDAIFSDFDARPESDRLKAEYSAFVTAGGAELQAFAAFEARSSGPSGDLQRAARFAMFVQWAADRQFAVAATAGRHAGLSIGLYRDLAVGAAPDGAEVASSGDRFARNVSIGAPPDAFSDQGQVWGVTPWSPLALVDAALLPFRQLIESNMRHAGALRIDHVLGLRRQFWVPNGAEAKEGAYIAFPEEPMHAMLRLLSRRMGVVVVGEDLGTVPDGLREALARSEILGTRVMPFEREGATLRPPSTYPRLAVTCAATHDLPSLAAWWAGDDVAERQRIGLLPASEIDRAMAERTAEKRVWTSALKAAGLGVFERTGDLTPDLLAAIHRFLAMSPSALVLVQAEDLAGSRAILNVPGTDRERPNWRARLDSPIERIFASSLAQTVLAAFSTRKA
jgi:glycogen operon protein